MSATKVRLGGIFAPPYRNVFSESPTGIGLTRCKPPPPTYTHTHTSHTAHPTHPPPPTQWDGDPGNCTSCTLGNGICKRFFCMNLATKCPTYEFHQCRRSAKTVIYLFVIINPFIKSDFGENGWMREISGRVLAELKRVGGRGEMR